MSCTVRATVLLLILAATFTASVHGRSSRFRGHSGGHHYPRSPGLSGHGSGGGHRYPSSPGLSGHGSGGGHGYPSSPGLSGHGSGGGHGYPSSPGLSGHGSSGGRGYPSSPGQPGHSSSDRHTYPHSTGSSGYGPHSTGHNNPGTGGTTNNVYHVYNPPQQIHYTPVHGAVPAQPYPIYQHTPPIYVNNFRDSGSKYSTLLTGLALYNLGRSGSHHSHHENGKVSPDNGEECSLRIEDGRDVDIVKIPCYIVSTFKDGPDKKIIVTTTPAPAPSVTTPSFALAPATSQAPSPAIAAVNATAAGNVTSMIPAANETLSYPVTNATLASPVQNSTSFMNATAVVQNATAVHNSSTVQNNATKLVDAETLKGEPVKLSGGARCFVERRSKTRYTMKEIECGLLQQYAMQSMQRRQRKPNSAANHNLSFSTLFIVTITAYALC